MKKSTTSSWFELMRMGSEMWLAAAEVIPRRVARMTTAKRPLSPRDRKEFTVMGTEKIDAAVLGMNACAWELALSAPRIAARNLKQLQNVGLGALGPTRRRIGASTSAGTSAATETLLKLTRTALKPAHKRVTANAKRLRKG